MKIALRGEGPTDMGKNDNGNFVKGPMVLLIEKLDCYCSLVEDCCGGVPEIIEWVLIDKNKIKSDKNNRKKVVLRSLKENDLQRKRFVRDAESFSQLAAKEEADFVIFFVDGDKGEQEEYEKRYDSIKDGLKLGGYEKKGVAMVPNKISEAWLLCCDTPGNCVQYEKLPTGDDSNPRNPKAIIRSRGKTPYQIADECDPNQIDMPSFNRFKKDFKKAINHYCKFKVCV